MKRIETLEAKAIKFIKTVATATDKPLFAGNSGGKDSAVVDYLLQKSGIEYVSYHTNTTLDPAGTINHLKKHYPHTQILKPKETFYQLIRRKGLPTRLMRWCCDELKEYGSIGKMVFEGVRAAESKNRKGRDYIQCDNRPKQEGAKHIYPIYDWTDNDVAQFIKLRGIVLAPHYAKANKVGLNRLGCVGCPLVATHVRKKEFALYPKVFENIKKAIKVGMQNNPQWKLTVATDGNEELAMKYWLSKKTINEFFDEYEFTGSTQKGWTKELKKINQQKLFKQ